MCQYSLELVGISSNDFDVLSMSSYFYFVCYCSQVNLPQVVQPGSKIRGPKVRTSSELAKYDQLLLDKFIRELFSPPK